MKKYYSYLIIIFLIVASCASFGRIAGNDFINLDDESYITQNNHIKSGINPESVKWAFTSSVVRNWIPLTMISHMLDWNIFGANPSGHHLISLLLHIGAVIFLFLFLNKTTNNIWPSAFAAAFFALHPLRVESVAWAAERKDVLSMFFGIASLCAYAFYAERSKCSQYLLCLILFALSLMAKSMLITLPFVFLLLDYWPLGRWQKEITAPTKKSFHMINRLIWEKIPFFFLIILSSIMTVWAQYEASSVYPSFHVRIFNAIVAYAAYLAKTFWPIDLTLVYFFVYSFPAWQIIASFFIVSGITIIVIYAFKKRPFLSVGWFWYLGTLIPVIGLVPTNALIADHYTYLPSVGIAIMLAWGIPSLIKSEKARKKILFPAAMVILGILIVLTWKQCGYWKNSIDLWNHTIKVTKNNVLAHINIAKCLVEEGKIEEAFYHYNEIIRISPYSIIAYNNRGNIYASRGQYKLAMEDYNKAISLKPDYADAYNNKGLACYELGEYKQAIENYNYALNLHPIDAVVYNNRAVAYFAQSADHIHKSFACRDAKKACELGNCKLLELAKGKGYCR